MPKLTLRQLQSQLASAPARWRAGTTKMSDLSLAEQERRLGLLVKEEERARVEAYLRQARAPRAVAFASASDWRNKNGHNWTTSIKDQGRCGSCVSFATVATIETQARLQFNKPTFNVELSEAELFFCGAGKRCDQGWWPTDAMEHAKAHGIAEEPCFPYQDHDMDCQQAADRANRLVTVVTYQEVIDVPARKEFLDKTGPMVACLAVYADFMHYESGIYEHRAGDLVGYHAVSCVGYDEPGQYWICKNSWSEDWGEDGYFKISYGEAEIDTGFAMFGVSKVSTTIAGLDGGGDEEVGDDWAEMVFAEHSFGSKKNVLWAFVKGKWRYQEVTEAELHGLGGTLFQATSVRAFYKGEKLDKLVGVKKY